MRNTKLYGRKSYNASMAKTLNGCEDMWRKATKLYGRKSYNASMAKTLDGCGDMWRKATKLYGRKSYNTSMAKTLNGERTNEVATPYGMSAWKSIRSFCR